MTSIFFLHGRSLMETHYEMELDICLNSFVEEEKYFSGGVGHVGLIVELMIFRVFSKLNHSIWLTMVDQPGVRDIFALSYRGLYLKMCNPMWSCSLRSPAWISYTFTSSGIKVVHLKIYWLQVTHLRVKFSIIYQASIYIHICQCQCHSAKISQTASSFLLDI